MLPKGLAPFRGVGCRYVWDRPGFPYTLACKSYPIFITLANFLGMCYHYYTSSSVPFPYTAFPTIKELCSWICITTFLTDTAVVKLKGGALVRPVEAVYQDVRVLPFAVSDPWLLCQNFKRVEWEQKGKDRLSPSGGQLRNWRTTRRW